MSDRACPLSIVMPSLNQADFIGAALDSILAGLPADGEIIVVDGGSTDGTQVILETYAAAAPHRLRWTSGADDGAAQAINRAIEHAAGEIIGWLNADDLYTEGAVRRALAHLDRTGDIMVYGEARHIDRFGRDLARYPTLPPHAGIEAFKAGCFICQPTVFARREMFVTLGGLDEALRTAFDMDLWLRAFARFPGRIGFIAEDQACSRLHAGTLTASQRETVAIEAMKVLHRHLGEAPADWVLTYVDEFLAAHPFGRRTVEPRAHLADVARAAAPFLSAGEAERLDVALAQDRRIAIANAAASIIAYPDGWAAPSATLRVRRSNTAWAAVILHGANRHPDGERLSIRVHGSDGETADHVFAPGDFSLRLALPRPYDRPADISFRLESSSFVPANLDRDDRDTRDLSFLLLGLDMSERS